MDKPEIEVVPAEQWHIDVVAKNMREADCLELWAASFSKPKKSLEAAFRLSKKCWTGLVDGEPACMFGVSRGTILSHVGAPWLLGTDLIEKNQLAFLRRNKLYMSEMTEGFDTLINYVDARNTKAIRWLKWLGFEFDEAEPRGVLNMPFHKFSMRVS